MQAKHIVDYTTGRWESEFTANGQTYHVLSPRDGLPPLRYTYLQQMLAVSVLNNPLGEIRAAFDRMEGHINSLTTAKPRLVDLVAELQSMKRGIVELKERKYDAAMYTAALFVIRPGEDVTKWDEHTAGGKIEDWNAEGIDAHDFFFLVALWVSQSAERLRASYDLLRAMGLISPPPGSTPSGEGG